jgi:hypothetical protein
LPNSETVICNSSQIRNSKIWNSSQNAKIKFVNSAGIIEFPKKEIHVTQNSKIVPTKIDFVEWQSPKMEIINTSVLAGIMIFGWNCGFNWNSGLILAGIMNSAEIMN